MNLLRLFNLNFFLPFVVTLLPIEIIQLVAVQNVYYHILLQLSAQLLESMKLKVVVVVIVIVAGAAAVVIITVITFIIFLLLDLIDIDVLMILFFSPIKSFHLSFFKKEQDFMLFIIAISQLSLVAKHYFLFSHSNCISIVTNRIHFTFAILILSLYTISLKQYNLYSSTIKDNFSAPSDPAKLDLLFLVSEKIKYPSDYH